MDKEKGEKIMKIGNKNIAQLKDGNWTEYRIFSGARFFLHKTVYTKKEIESEKYKLSEAAYKDRCRIQFRTVKSRGGWTIWYRRLVGRR